MHKKLGDSKLSYVSIKKKTTRDSVKAGCASLKLNEIAILMRHEKFYYKKNCLKP